MRTIEFEEVRDRCLSKPTSPRNFPLTKTRVWKVAGKVLPWRISDAFDGVTLKCDPEYAVELREQHTGIIGGYHANKALEYSPVGSRCSTCTGPRLD